MKPIRSFLYAPGNRPRLIEKAPDAGADAVMFDLADSVPNHEKDVARRLIPEAIARLRGRNLYVKLNDADSPRVLEDIDAVVVEGLCGVLVPKVSVAEEVRAIDRALAERERARSLRVGSIEIILLVETASALLRAHDIASASSRVVSLCVGTAEGGDLIRSLGAAWSLTGPERTYLRGRVLLAARAARLPWPIDGVYTNLNDQQGLETEAGLARRFGFRGKLAIHPKQVEPINRIFSPTREEIARSRRVIEAHAEAQARGIGQFAVDGILIGDAAAAHARTILASAGEHTV